MRCPKSRFLYSLRNMLNNALMQSLPAPPFFLSCFFLLSLPYLLFMEEHHHLMTKCYLLFNPNIMDNLGIKKILSHSIIVSVNIISFKPKGI